VIEGGLSPGRRKRDDRAGGRRRKVPGREKTKGSRVQRKKRPRLFSRKAASTTIAAKRESLIRSRKTGGGMKNCSGSKENHLLPLGKNKNDPTKKSL